MEAMKISLSGLDVEWTRMQVIAENIANLNSAVSDPGQGFAPRRLTSGPTIGYSAVLMGASGAQPPRGVQVMSIDPVADGLRQVFEPGHPAANTEGFVTYPKIDYAAEMTMLLKSSRVYEANLTSISIAQQMYARALEMGRRS
ncbi:flagellar basal body rod C-terminal domain-containing protein [Hyphomonas sp.]|uniref:flagellar basal body rod protein FlgC n=1 Tax=Hyphomonas sp. TaxID=87 RepID=UPI0025C41429|nr:flagellar basal body rod C-terminal domain-containing protein [Hyphomonas sp.]